MHSDLIKENIQMGDIGDSFKETKDFFREGRHLRCDKNIKYLLKVTDFVITELTRINIESSVLVLATLWTYIRPIRDITTLLHKNEAIIRRYRPS